MTDGRGSQPQSGFLPKVDYDRDAPSSVFTQHQVDYVESIAAILSPADLERVRSIEWFMYNANSNAYGDCFVPGLRGDVDIRGVPKQFVYFKRFSDLPYSKLVDLFLEYKPASWPKAGSGASMAGYRVTTPSGDRFYPIEMFDDFEAWRQRLAESAAMLGSELAHFDQGTFVIADRQRIGFGDLRVELLKSRRYPKTW